MNPCRERERSVLYKNYHMETPGKEKNDFLATRIPHKDSSVKHGAGRTFPFGKGSFFRDN